MTERTRASWIIYVLGALCARRDRGCRPRGRAGIRQHLDGHAHGHRREGVVQSTVSGSGNLQPASQLDLGFKTTGTVSHIYVTQGEQVVAGQLLATLDPQSAEVTLEQSEARAEVG